MELADMASEFGVSTRKLMAGIMNGTYDRIGEEDLVRGDKGDPLFFRIGRMRAFSIFGENLDRVEKNMSSIEEMDSMGTTSRKNTPDSGGPSLPSTGGGIYTRPETETGGSVATSTVDSATARGKTSTATEVATPTEEAPPQKTTSTEKVSRANQAPPARTDRSPQGGAVQTKREETGVQKRENAGVPAKTGQETSTVAQVGKTALAVAGVYAGVTTLVSLLSGGQGQNQQARGLSGRQKQDLFDQGYYDYYQGVEYNPYDPATEEGRLYEQGWMEGRRQAIKNPVVDTRLA